MSQVINIVSDIPEPTSEELLMAYKVGIRSRALEEHIVKLVSRGEVKFAIWVLERDSRCCNGFGFIGMTDPTRFGIVPHYRSGCLCSMWCELNGKSDFSEDVLRQQFSKDTDKMSRGRRWFIISILKRWGFYRFNLLLVCRLGKAAGYAKGFQMRGIHDGVAIGIVGDGTTAEGDMHDAMNAASVWQVPFLLMVTDNGVAISTILMKGEE